MANSKAVNLWSPGFIEELLPCSQQISLLYHISYLCLAKFPKLERLLRMRAVETQLLFGSSEALLLKCVGTSQNLISSLFPMLINAVERNKSTLAVKYLEKARTWITEIIQDVGKMVERYDVHTRDVTTTTSDVITEQKDTEKELNQLSEEIQAIMKSLDTLQKELNDTTRQLLETERQIDARNRDLQDLVRSAASRSRGFSIFAAVVPFIGPLVQSIYNATTGTTIAEKTRALEAELNRLHTEKISLKQKEWNLQVQTIDWNMKLAKLKIAKGSIPNPVHLGEVQRYLTKIKDILVTLKRFWENVYSLLGTMKEKTFVNEDAIDDPDLKAEFVQSIQKASNVWQTFSGFCSEAIQIFRVQSKNAYKFLEINPDSLSEAVWQKEYDSVKKQLLELNILSKNAAPAIGQ